MHISSAALLLLIPSTWAATIPVVNTVDGIVESAVVVTNPSIVSGENTHFSRDVGKTTDGIQIPDVDLKSAQELASTLTDPGTITGRSLENFTSILKEISSIKEKLKNTLEGVSEHASWHIKEIFDELNEDLRLLEQRIAEILNRGDNKLGLRDVGNMAEEAQRLAQGLLLEVLVDLDTLKGVVENQIREVTDVVREEAERQISEFRLRLAEIKRRIVEVLTIYLESKSLVSRDV
ncbi:hypothetical protein V496_10472 [Pseudogymnoascus sp. VKM F-4515 (FW-2607)]|nr:hypothetical protein V496_10472 [Pseudogymnoascus sp. VKM F-4515 (FW-2607)]KFY88993.1 hypothetical protein V498_06565 [Pseudogymnoascus sp. VKM F-4517 (FW-2822)]